MGGRVRVVVGGRVVVVVGGRVVVVDEVWVVVGRSAVVDGNTDVSVVEGNEVVDGGGAASTSSNGEVGRVATNHSSAPRTTIVVMPSAAPKSRRSGGTGAWWRPIGQRARAATSADGVGQVPAVSPEQHSSWSRPNIGQRLSRQAAWPWT